MNLTHPPVKQQLRYRHRYLLLGLLLLISLHGRAQLTLHSAYMLGVYTDRVSITLDSGFTSEPEYLQSLELYIDTATVGPLAVRPDHSVNYVVAYTPRVAGIGNPADTTLTNAQVSAGIQYADGLGRPIQNIAVQGSPMGYDVIQPVGYDSMGRASKQYLPYTMNIANAGDYRRHALSSEQPAYYDPSTAINSHMATTAYAYAQTVYERSPLNRVLEQGATGADWQPGGHTRGIAYTTNDTLALGSGGRRVKQYFIDAYGSLSAAGLYAPGTLNVTVTHDENWSSSDSRLGTTETYTDAGSGRTLLKRTFNYNAATPATEVLSTYYVYDNLWNLRYILPPQADPDNAIADSTLNNLCYRYTYDAQNRLTGKKIPGKGSSYILYNPLDRPALAQDSVQRAGYHWAALKYDRLGRVIMTGTWDAGSSKTLTALQDSLDKHAGYDQRDTTNTTTGYAISSYPALSHTLSINYYDDYNIPNLPAGYDLHNDTAYTKNTQGLLTATRTAVLQADGSISSTMLWTVYYYDNKGRHSKTIKQHYLGGVQSAYNYDEVSATYNFSDQATQTLRKHYTKNSGNTAAVLAVTVKDSLTYDPAGRPKQAWNQINNQSKVLLSQVDYNELGQAITKHIHSSNGNTFLQNISYSYNERGWLTQSSAPLFAEQLKYNDGSTPQYNGNIANQLWGKGSTLNNTYTYSYDKINRLTDGSSTSMSETGISYDVAGNIRSLTRDGHTISYSYTGGSKQLNAVSGTGVQSGTYSYDGNGNVADDGSNGYRFRSNLLNLTRQVTKSTDTISYAYDASGTKLSKTSTATGQTEYVNGIQYGSNTGSYGIDFIPVAGGVAERKSDGSYRYEYDLTDHLGNTRVTIQENPTTHTADTLQRDDYYPFGLQRSLLAGDNKYLYNGKEVQEEFNQYDYGARLYNPAIGRWNGVDQLAELYSGMSPYNYVMNSPINYTDPDGRCAGCNVTDKDCPSCAKAYPHPEEGKVYIDGRTIYIYKNSKWEKQDGGTLLDDVATARSRKTMPLPGACIACEQIDNYDNIEGGGSQEGLNAAGTATDIAGGLYNAAEKLVVTGEQWLGKNGKYNSMNWGGNRFTGSRLGALEAAERYKWAGRATVGLSIGIGGLQVYGGYQQDGGQFGYHTQTAAAGATGGLIGGWAGANGGAVIGGIIGGAFGGVGAIPGAAIGGLVFGYFGSQAGSALGSGAVNYYYDQR